MTQIFNIIFFIILHTVPLTVLAQNTWQGDSAGAIFAAAREQAFHGDRQAACEMLQYILKQQPDHHDVRVFLGRTYGWAGRFAEAEKELQTVLAKSAHHEDAFEALIDIKIWAGEFEHALILANSAIEIYPDAGAFLLKRARILRGLGRKTDAIVLLKQFPVSDPAREEALDLLKTIEREELKYTAGVYYGVDLFSKTFRPAHYASVEMGRKNAWGTSTLRFNYLNRFGTNAIQSEVDLYPEITKGVYGYLNYGYSAADLFPQHRAGAEIFSRLPYALEASAGVRNLLFDGHKRIVVYTGSIGWYFRDYWISARPYITPRQETSTSIATIISLRRYFATSNDYLSLSAGIGFSPDERRLQTGSGLTTDGIDMLKSNRIAIAWHKSVARNFLFHLNAEVVRQELGFALGEYVLITNLGVGLKKQF